MKTIISVKTFTVQKIKLSIKDFFSKSDKIRRKHFLCSDYCSKVVVVRDRLLQTRMTVNTFGLGEIILHIEDDDRKREGFTRLFFCFVLILTMLNT